MRKYGSIFVLLSLLVLAVAGCTAPVPTSVPDAQAAVCTALEGLRTAVAQVGTVSADTTVEEVESIQAGIDTAVTTLERAVEAVPEAKIDGVKTAIEGLQGAVRTVAPSDTLGDAAESITTAAEGVVTAIEETQSTLSCR